MADPTVPLSLSIGAMRRIESVCTRFEQQSDSKARDLTEWLTDFEGIERRALLQELVALDAELRRRRGESPSEEDYQHLIDQTQPECLDVPSNFLNISLRDLVDSSETSYSSERYQFKDQIGKGGIGQVWRVFDNHSQRDLAVKLLHRKFKLHPSAVARFQREGLLTGTLQHPGIPPIYDRGQLTDGTPYFAMKLVDGETLDTILRNENSDDQASVQNLDIFLQVAQTLAYAHSQHVVHRDLKPQNVMVGRFGEVQLMDWGLAKQMPGAAIFIEGDNPFDDSNRVGVLPDTSSVTNPNGSVATPAVDPNADTTRDPIGNLSGNTPVSGQLTQHGDVVGTPSYMAPEQARGDAEAINARTDVFGLGAILFQLLTRQKLFQGDSPAAIVRQCADGDLEHALKTLDAFPIQSDLIEICRQCIQPDPANRPKNASEVARRTQAYLADTQQKLRQIEIERDLSEVKTSERIKRQRLALTLTSALAALFFCGVVAVLWQWRLANEARKGETEALQIAKQESAITKEVNDYMLSMLSTPLPDKGGYDVRFADVILHSLPRLEHRFPEQPAVEAEIRATLGETFRWLGVLDESELQYDRALTIMNRCEEIEEERVLYVMDRLAGVLRSRGDTERVERAEELRSKVVRRTSEIYGPTHAETILAMNNLGAVYLESGKGAEAEELYRNAIESAKSIPEEDRDIIRLPIMIGNLADAYRMQGQLQEAEKTYLDAFSLWQKRSNPSRSAANAYVTYAMMLGEQSRDEEADKWLRRAGSAREEIFGPNNPLTLSAYRKLSRSLYKQKKYDEALTLAKTILPRHQDSYREHSRDVFGVRQILAKSLRGLGRIDEARDVMEKSYQVLRDGRGKDDRVTLDAKKQLDELVEDS